MNIQELKERGFTIDEDKRVIDDAGNEYRDEKGEVCFLEGEFTMCPKCHKPIKSVRVYSECYQIGTLKGLAIIDYGRIEEITDTVAIECPECSADIIDFISQ